MTVNRQALYQYLDRKLDDFRPIKKLRLRSVLEEISHIRPTPKFKTDPWLHQLVCFYIGVYHPEFLYLLDMGLGKSKILSDLITHKQRSKDLRGALVLVPNVVNMASWEEDLLRHSDLEPWSCAVANKDEKWDRLADPAGDVTFIDYQGLHLAICDNVKDKKTGKGRLVLNEKKLRRVRSLYNLLGMDESHKLRNHQNLWFSVVSKISAGMDFTYAMTGTPFGKNPEALWSQFYLVDKGLTFGENLGLFHDAFFGITSDNFSSTYTFNKKTAPELTRMMQHRSIRYAEEEVPEIDIPRKVVTVQRGNMGDEQREHYLRALQGLLDVKGGELSEMEAPWTRMRQISSGYLVFKDAHGQHTIFFKDNPKLDMLDNLLLGMGDSKVVICHYYTPTGQMLVDHIKKAGIGVTWLYGGTKDKVKVREQFMRDPSCQVLVMNTEAGGTGNNGLQEVARYMVFYESPTPPDVRAQVEKRLHRPGQKKRTFIYDLVLRKTLDGGILESIKEGHDLFNTVVNGRTFSKILLG